MQSRYYNPTLGRFINADAFASTGQGILGNNMYAYCGNNPVNNVDPGGACFYNAKGQWCHDNWEFIGGYQRKPDPGAVDVTEMLDVALVDHAIEFSEYADTYSSIDTDIFFADNCRSGSDWDLKSEGAWNLDPKQLYRYKNILLTYDDIGNIHYGYVGRVVFDLNTLLVFAGAYQIVSNTSDLSYINSNFDDPRDQWAIRVGYNLWN